MEDYYKILELEFGADIETVKKSYRRLALRYHPDKNKAADAASKFIEITEAYEVLSNETSKKQYDALYIAFFKSENRKTQFEENLKAQEWTNYGKKKAEEYASMNYDEFANRIIDELRLGISYTPNLFFIIFCITGVIGSFYVMGFSFLLGLVIFGGYSTLCYFLYERAKKDYIAERRHKILNKYK